MVKNSDIKAKWGMRKVPNAEFGMRNAESPGKVARGVTLTLKFRIPHSPFRISHVPHCALSSHARPRPSPQEPQQHSAGPDLGELLRRRARHPPGGAGEVSG